jgi:hypothetical protein
MYTALFVTTAGLSVLSWVQYLFTGLSLLKQHKEGRPPTSRVETPDDTSAK